MIDKEFIDNKHSYRINVADMESFLAECEEKHMMWHHGKYPTEFNPFKMYEGENIKYIEPVMNIDDRNYVYVRCFNDILYFSYQWDWIMTPYKDYIAIRSMDDD